MLTKTCDVIKITLQHAYPMYDVGTRLGIRAYVLGL